ncbi:pyrophosphate-energized vacuolar membrane proton pump-like [Hordeum vulgare subsp. vulgare]|uniref:pyrophosphate-energized vacuolar membrane proton pump-like n=1 Tax=Hordeum vulgare subsp. vulgare TaxID=112509 RepID=UPI001D1A5B3C|nr:pyrophosphate-energized vacuolar membrane proton pump-like [Hordeum vulgare subsp. vulgare]
MAILGELGTEILIPVCGVIGIVFAVAQWFIVSKVKVTPSAASAAVDAKNGYGDYLIEEEEGLNDHNVVIKCAEIQTAISEGELTHPLRQQRWWLPPLPLTRSLPQIWFSASQARKLWSP